MSGALKMMSVRSADAVRPKGDDNYGWDAIMAAAAAVDPARVRSATKADNQ